MLQMVGDGSTTAMGEPTAVRYPSLQRHTQEHHAALRYLRECSGRNDAYLYAIRGSAYTQILYVHGLQDFVYSLESGNALNLYDYDNDRYTVIFNVIMPAVEARKALLLSREPKREARATTRDERDIEAAQYASDVMDWGAERFRVKEIAAETADWMVKTGNAIHFHGWDPTGGDMLRTQDGRIMFTGEPIWRVDSMFAWTFHPQAKRVDDSPYAHHEGLVSHDWVEEHFPEAAAVMPDDDEYYSDSSRMFERALMNLSPSHAGWGGGGTSNRVPEGQGFHELQTCYWRSSPRWPQGRMIMALARGGDPFYLLHDGPNPYVDHATGRRTLPVVLFKDIPLPGRLWGDSIVLHAMPMQDAVNNLRGQIYRNAQLLANPQMYFYEDGMNPTSVTNEPGGMIPLAPGSQPPGYLQPPELPSYLIQGEQAALQFLDIMLRPSGPMQAEEDRKITSGIHQMIVNERRQEMLSPLMQSWESCWDASWKRWIDNWRTFASLPVKIGVPGDDGGWRESYFSGQLARRNFTVRVVPGSAMPASRTATFSEWMEMVKVGAAPIQMDQMLAKQFWDDIGKGHMTRTYRDIEADANKARRNIQKIRLGVQALAEPQDNIDVHLTIYSNWMKSAEWERLIEQNPLAEHMMLVLRDSFVQAKNMQMMAAAQQMAMAQPQEPGRPGGGDAGQHTASQGLSKAHEQAQNPGGNPTGNNGS